LNKIYILIYSFLKTFFPVHYIPDIICCYNYKNKKCTHYSCNNFSFIHTLNKRFFFIYLLIQFLNICNKFLSLKLIILFTFSIISSSFSIFCISSFNSEISFLRFLSRILFFKYFHHSYNPLGYFHFYYLHQKYFEILFSFYSGL
jgi:hypothetical protein